MFSFAKRPSLRRTSINPQTIPAIPRSESSPAHRVAQTILHLRATPYDRQQRSFRWFGALARRGTRTQHLHLALESFPESYVAYAWSLTASLFEEIDHDVYGIDDDRVQDLKGYLGKMSPSECFRDHLRCSSRKRCFWPSTMTNGLRCVSVDMLTESQRAGLWPQPHLSKSIVLRAYCSLNDRIHGTIADPLITSLFPCVSSRTASHCSYCSGQHIYQILPIPFR